MMKFNPLLLTIAFLAISIFSSFQTQGQKTIQAADQSVIKQLYDHDHRKCGSDAMTDQLMNANPDYAREVQEFKKRMIPALAKNQSQRVVAPIIYVPVVVHVIHNGEAVGTGANISEGQILAQIEVLNLDFSAMNSNYNDTPAQWQDDIGNPEVQFCMAIIDPNGDPTNGITRHDIAVTGTNASNNNIEDEIKPATWWDSDEYYNIYVLGIPGTGPGGGTTGYAYYPTNGMIGTVLDGSVVDYNWFGGPGYGQSGSGTLTHETGHYLGLPHPFDGEDCGDDDMIADTPNMDAPTSDYNPGLNCSPGNFPAGPVSCGNEHMYVNYMDYVNDDDCSTSFTLEQINVMRGVLEGNPPTDSFPSYASRFPLTQNATTVCSFFDNDAGITSIINPTENICGGGMITPMVNLQNFGESNLTTVTISYEINNGTPVDFIWIDNLGTGETQTVDLASFTPPVGDYTFTVYTNLPNGVTDEQTDNDQSEITVTTVIPTNLPLFENFEDALWDPTANGVFQFNISGDAFEWERSTDASGYEIGGACAVFDNYASNGGANPGGTADALITSVYDFNIVSGASLSFDVAYAPYDDTFFDSLKVFASIDCGSSFTELLYADGNTGLATAPAATAPFTPSAAQWATKNIDLSAYDNTDNLTIAIVNQSGFGNRLFIDNINLSAGCSMSLSANGTDPTCFQQCDGIAGVTISDGSTPYTYQWDVNANSSTAETVQNLCEGTYSVTVTDAASCTAEVMVELTDPSSIILMVSHTNETTPNANDGTATANASGGTGMLTYLWSNSESTQTITNLEPGTYTVVVTDINGCAETDNVTVEAVPCTMSLDPVGTDLLCNGDCNGTVMVVPANGSAPYTFQWDANANSSTDSFVVDLCAGFYGVTVTDANDCTAEVEVEITEPTALDLVMTSTDVTTVGGTDGTATADISNGTAPYIYLWNDPIGQTTQTAIDLVEGTYCVTVSDNNNCSIESCVTINGIDCSSFAVSAEGENVSCFGFQNGVVSATAENGMEPYAYEWNTGDETAVVSGLNAGTYTVTATDAQGCTSEAFVTISEPDFLSVTVMCTDETIDGANDGTCTAMHTGGTSPFTEDWSNGDIGTLTITDLSPGLYCVTITDGEGCTEENCGTVNGVDCNLSADLNLESITCNGFQNGTAEVIVSGGTDPVVIAWSTGESTSQIDGLSPGGYSVTVSDVQNCETILQFNITEPDAISISFNTTNPSSNGGNDGSATATPSGGTPGYEFAWSNGINAQTISDLIAGVYVVTITDINGCTEINEVELEDPVIDCSSFEGEMITSDAICGFNEGSAEALVTGGMEPYEYLWSNAGEMTSSIFGLQAGMYSVTVTDANDCELILMGEVLAPEPLSVSLSGTPPSAPGAQDGLISATPFGGVPDYTYLWNTVPIQTTQTITLLPEGTYSVTVTDANGCTAENVITIEDPSVDCGSFDGQLVTTNMTCSTMGSIESVANGGTMPYEYLWSNDETTASIDGLTAGIYTVTITDGNDCEMMMSSEISTPPMLNVVESGTNPSSPGGNDGTATATASDGLPSYNYQWDNGGTTATITGLSAGTYTVIVTDSNDCSETVSMTLINPSIDCGDFVVNIPSVVEITCNGFQNGALVAMAANGELPYSYVWSNGVMTAVNAGLGAGVYSVTATDLNGCTAEAEVELVEPSALELTITSVPVSTVGAMDGSATANPTGGTPDYTYEWSNSELTQTINNLAVGTYTVTVTDANGCVSSETVTIGIDGVDCSNFSIVDFEVFNVNCFGGFDGSVTAISEGGTEPILYEWSNAATGQTISGLQSGIYVVTATDANDCQTVNEVEISQPAAGINVDFGTTPESSPGASDGAIDVTVTGGTPAYGYEWSNGAMTEDLDNIEAGTYELVITDANGCVHSISIIVSGSGVDCSTFIIDAQMENVSCNGAEDGLIVTTASGGIQPITYNWDNGETTQSLFNLSGGIYVVTVVDGNGCEIIEEFEITEATPINLTPFSSDETAVGANDGTAAVAASGGTPTYTYLWSNGAVTASIFDLEPGTYSVTVTDAAGCTSVENFEIEAFSDFCAGFDATVESTPVDCNGNNNGTATALPTGGLAPYSYDWSNGSNSANNNNISGGSYSVTISDANQCEIILSVDVDEPNDLGVNVEGFGGTCGSGGTAVSTVTGGTQAYTYQWSNGGTGSSISNLADGVYMVTVTDANGCSIDGETVIENTIGGIDIESEVDGISCFGDSDGEVDITVIEGTAPFTFEWSNGATTEDLDDVEGGTYNVLITDAEGCSFVTAFVVPSPAELLASVNVTPSGGNNMGSATANAFGGTTPYSYSWSNGAGGFFVDNLANGSYTLTVTDANGCTTETDFIISTTAINELPGLEEMNVSPNPSNGQFILNATFTSFKQGSIEVYNVIGQRVYQQNFSTQNLTLDIGLLNQAAGSYFLVIRTEEGRAIEKLMITK